MRASCVEKTPTGSKNERGKTINYLKDNLLIIESVTCYPLILQLILLFLLTLLMTMKANGDNSDGILLNEPKIVGISTAGQLANGETTSTRTKERFFARNSNISFRVLYIQLLCIICIAFYP